MADVVTELRWLHVPFGEIKKRLLEENETKRQEFKSTDNDTLFNTKIICGDEKKMEKMNLNEYFAFKETFKQDFDKFHAMLKLDEPQNDAFADIRFSFRLYNAWDEEKDRVKLVSRDQAYSTYRRHKYCLDQIYSTIMSLGLKDEITHRGTSTYIQEWTRMTRLLYMSYINLVVNHIMAIDRSGSSPQHHSFERCTEVQDFLEKNLFKSKSKNRVAPFRVMFNSCLKTIQRLKLIRRKNEFLIQTYVNEPHSDQIHGTSYYRKYCEVKNFMSELQSSGDQKEMFDLYWGKANIRSSVENCLEHSKDSNLVDYRVMPGVVSFKSHLYYGPEDKWWYHWDHKKPNNYHSICYIDDELDTREIKNSIMELAHHPKTGELNPLVSLFRTQKYTDEEIEAVAGILGRNLQKFKPDNRELFVFLKGVAGTGKSSLIELISSFFDSFLIANLSNKQEETFGLQGFEEKSLIVASDLTASSTMDSGDILNMISGDLMTIRIKNKPQEFTRLSAHFLGAGNGVPAKWNDVGGNFRRRVFPIDFKELPSPPDPAFKPKLLQSGGTSYRFLNCGFLRLLREVQGGDIWTHLPPRFLKNRDEFLAESSALRAFFYEMESNKFLQYNSEYYWKYEDFESRFKAYALHKNFQMWREECKQDRIAPIFGEHKCKIIQNVARMWPIHVKEGGPAPKMVTGEWIIGAAFVKLPEFGDKASESTTNFMLTPSLATTSQPKTRKRRGHDVDDHNNGSDQNDHNDQHSDLQSQYSHSDVSPGKSRDKSDKSRGRPKRHRTEEEVQDGRDLQDPQDIQDIQDPQENHGPDHMDIDTEMLMSHENFENHANQSQDTMFKCILCDTGYKKKQMSYFTCNTCDNLVICEYCHRKKQGELKTKRPEHVKNTHTWEEHQRQPQ